MHLHPASNERMGTGARTIESNSLDYALCVPLPVVSVFNCSPWPLNCETRPSSRRKDGKQRERGSQKTLFCQRRPDGLTNLSLTSTKAKVLTAREHEIQKTGRRPKPSVDTQSSTRAQLCKILHISSLESWGCLRRTH